MPSPAANRLARAHQAELAAVGALVQQRVRRLAAGVDLVNVDAWWRRVLRELVALVAAAWRAARALGVRYLTRHAELEGAAVEPVGAVWDTARVASALRVTGPVEFKRHVAAGGSPARARAAMSTTLAGSAQRLALAGERDTVAATVRDADDIVGWRRQTDANPCAFCAMLASRGAVYKSAATAGDTGFGGVQYHDHDQCVAVPLYEREEEPPEVEQLQDAWRRVTAGKSGRAAIREWRRWWDENRGELAPAVVVQREPEVRQEPVQLPAPTPVAGQEIRVRDERLRQLVGDELDRQAALMPSTAPRLERVIDTGRPALWDGGAHAYYEIHDAEIHLHPEWSTPEGRERLGAVTAKAVRAGWWTPTDYDDRPADALAGSVFAHEFGHHVTRSFADDDGVVDPRLADLLLRTVGEQLGITVERVGLVTTLARLTERLNAAVDGASRVQLTRLVSGYAGENGWELLAEVWREYSTRGPRARPHIRAIGDVMRQIAETVSRGG